MNIEQLARDLGVARVPEAWKTHWEAFEEWRSSGACTAEMGVIPSDSADVFDIPAECMSDLETVYAEIRKGPALTELAHLWHFLLFHQPGTRGLGEDVLPAPVGVLGRRAPIFHIAVLASGTEHSLRVFRDSGISESIMLDSLRQCGSQMRDHYERYGVFGMRFLGWMRNYFNAMMFRLGRLVFNANDYTWPFRVYGHRVTGELVTLCDGGRRYRTDGIADGTNGISDPDAWTAELEIGPGYVRGCPALPDARADRQSVCLDTREWSPLITPGDHMIEIHIPGYNSGGKLMWDDCLESYRQAIEFIPRHYPRMNFTSFTCWSWLLDPSLRKILPPESNIVRFQSPFHLLPVLGSDGQCYDLAFGAEAGFDIEAFTPTTSLQRAIRDYVLADNRMRSTAGYITINEMRILAGV